MDSRSPAARYNDSSPHHAVLSFFLRFSGMNALPRAAMTIAFGLALAAFCVVTSGCGPSGGSRGGFQQDDAPVQDENQRFLQGINLLEHPDDYGSSQAQQMALRYLSQWIEQQPEPAWQRDPMLDGLPKDLQPWVEAARLEELSFDAADMAWLTEMFWLRNVSRWAADKPPPPAAMQAFLAELKTAKGDEVATELAVAERLFDWTVRNLQLEPLPTGGAGAIVGPLGPDLPGKRAVGPATAIVPPGARYFPGEAILLGTGDALVRARVFIQLLRERRIDAVMLGLYKAKSQATEAWAVGVHLGGELYLFDPAVGLPVTGPGGRGIATWKQIQTDPTLLRQMDLGDKDKYPVEAADLGGTIAWIDADPVALSKRMQVVESKLTGEQRAVLTVDPSRIKKSLGSISGLIDVRLWTVPLYAYVYKRRLERDPQARAAAERLAMIHGILAHVITRYGEVDPRRLQMDGGTNQLFQGRVRHLAGKLSEERLGAKQCYLSCRQTKGMLDLLDAAEHNDAALAKIPEARMILQANPKFFEDKKARKKYLGQMREIIVDVRRRATYWLGIAAFDAGNFDVAANHLSMRLLDEEEVKELTPGTRFNLARAYEQLGNFDKAREILFQDDSVQRFGSELRARQLPEK